MRRPSTPRRPPIAAADELEHLVLAVLAQPRCLGDADHNKSYHDPDGRYRPPSCGRDLDDYQDARATTPRSPGRAEAQASVRAAGRVADRI